MAWTTPRTWVAGETVTAALMNTHVRDNLSALQPGGAAWTSVTFSAGNFTGGGTQTWTLTSGDQDTFRYVEIGKTMIVQVVLLTTSVGGTAHPELRLTIPNGRTTASTSAGTLFGLNNGVSAYPCYQADSGATYVRIFVDPTLATNWTASTNNTQIRGTFVLHVS